MQRVATLALWLSALVACSGDGSQAHDTSGARTLTLGAYTTPREAYREILPAFAADWQAKTGGTIAFEESYLGSGAQARAIAGGFVVG